MNIDTARFEIPKRLYCQRLIYRSPLPLNSRWEINWEINPIDELTDQFLDFQISISEGRPARFVVRTRLKVRIDDDDLDAKLSNTLTVTYKKFKIISRSREVQKELNERNEK